MRGVKGERERRKERDKKEGGNLLQFIIGEMWTDCIFDYIKNYLLQTKWYCVISRTCSKIISDKAGAGRRHSWKQDYHKLITVEVGWWVHMGLLYYSIFVYAGKFLYKKYFTDIILKIP